MALQRIVGNEGSVTFGVDAGTGHTQHTLVANAWSMTISRVISDVSAYGDTAAEVVGGVHTTTGSVSGFMATGSLDPELDPVDFTSASKVYLVLQAATGCTYTTIDDATHGQGAVVTGVSVSSSKTGDATISFDFSVDGYLTEAWDQTP